MVDRAAFGPGVGGERCREAAAQRAHEGGQARPGGDLVRFQVRQQDLQHRHEEQRHADALEQLHPGHVREVHVQVEVRAREAGERHRHEGEAGQQAQVEAARVLAHERRQQHRQDADRRGGEAGPDRGIAEVALQPQRHQDADAEEGRVGHHHRGGAGAEIAVPEQAQVDDRILVCEFPDHEHHQRDRGHDGEHHDGGRGEPVLVVAQVEQDLQRAHAQHQRGQADVVHLRLLQPLRPTPELRADDEAGKDADGNVDEEDPFPAVVVGDPAAEDRAGDRRDHGDHRQQRNRLPALGRRIDRQQQCLRHRVHRSRDETLQRARADQQAHRVGDAAQERGDHERHRRPHEQLALAEVAAEPAGQRQRDGIAHGERGDHPGRLVGAAAEVAGDGRQRHVGDRGVQHLHERRQRKAERGERPVARGEAGRRHRRRRFGTLWQFA